MERGWDWAGGSNLAAIAFVRPKVWGFDVIDGAGTSDPGSATPDFSDRSKEEAGPGLLGDVGPLDEKREKNFFMMAPFADWLIGGGSQFKP